MKRVKAACLMQTLHFQIKEELPHDEAVKLVQEDVRRYREQLKRRNVRHVIDEERTEPDGSVIIKIRKQYISSPVGDYLD